MTFASVVELAPLSGVKSITTDMWHVYILKSLKDGRYYIGCTHQKIEDRIAGHNRGDTPATKNRRPLELVYSEDVEKQADAFAREKQIKSFKGGNSFKKLLT